MICPNVNLVYLITSFSIIEENELDNYCFSYVVILETKRQIQDNPIPKIHWILVYNKQS